MNTDLHKRNISEFPKINEIINKIPPHVFKTDLKRSMYHFLENVGLIFITWCLQYYVLPTFTLPIYWFFQGLWFWSLFVIGHDCDHNAFSVYPWLDELIGTICHTFLLTPFNSWKISHNIHHKYICHLEKEDPYTPVHKKNLPYPNFKFHKWFGLGLSYIFYIIFGYHNNPPERVFYHFWPSHKDYKNKKFEFVRSIIPVVLWMFYLLYNFSISMILYYFIPFFVFASFFVFVTFMNHNEKDQVEWVGDGEWCKLKAALQGSIDRDYGYFLNKAMKYIGTYHQIHHLFPSIPHYHLEEATLFFRENFPELVKFSDENVIKAFIKNFENFQKKFVIADDCKRVVL